MLTIDVPSDGSVRVPNSDWFLAPVDPGLCTDPSHIEANTSAATIWVDRLAPLVVLVHDTEDRSIPGAGVRWRRAEALNTDTSWSSPTQTGAEGEVRIPGVPAHDIQIAVTAPGFVSRCVSLADASGPQTVLLERAEATHAIRLVDAHDGSPILASANFSDAYGSVDSKYTNGVWHVRWHAETSADKLTIDAGGYCTAFVRVDSLRRAQPETAVPVVPLLRRVDLTLQTASGVDIFHALVAVLDLPVSLPDGVKIATRDWAENRPPASMTYCVPEGAEVQVNVLDVTDAAGSRRGRVLSAESTWIVNTQPCSTLRIALQDSKGNWVRSARAQINRKSSESTLRQFQRTAEDGWIHVVNPECVSRIRIKGDGFADLLLIPDPGSPKRDGELRITMQEVHPVSVHVIDESDAPVPGAHVAFVAIGGADIALSPDNTDRLPIGHSSWRRQARSGTTTHTDASGFAKALLPAGQWRTDVSVAGRVPPYADVSADDSRKFDLKTPLTLSIKVSTVRAIAIEVRDALTRQVISGARVVAYESGVAKVSGDLSGVQGIVGVPKSVDRIDISARGYQPRSYSADDLQGSCLHARLWKGGLGTLHLTGEAAKELVGKTIRVSAWSSRDRDAERLWRGRFAVENLTNLSLDVPLDGPATLRIDADFPFVFDPVQDVWHRGSTVRFAVRKQ